MIDVLRRWSYPVGLHEAGASHTAATDGRVDRLRDLLAGGGCSTARTRDEHQWTPLHWAAFKGHPASVALLLGHGADPNGLTPDGDTPLHLAAGSSGAPYGEIIRLLLDAGADVNRRSRDGTALDAAAANAPDNISRLLAAGARVNRGGSTGQTPLFAAVSSHRVDSLTRLLAAGANPNAKRDDGSTLLQIAVTESERTPSSWRPTETVQMVRALLDARADPNSSDRRNPPPLLALLRSAGTRMREYNGRRWPQPLQAAVDRHIVEMARLLLGAGANPNGSWNDARGESHSPLKAAVGTAFYERDKFSPGNAWDRARLELVRALIAAGADPSQNDCPVAAFVVRTGDIALLRAVLAGRAEVNLAASSDERPLYIAVTERNAEAARLLIAAGANVNAPDPFGKSMLTRARENNDAAMVTLLLARGARE